jgi:DNA-binding transcriptional ArsR family regulator
MIAINDTRDPLDRTLRALPASTHPYSVGVNSVFARLWDELAPQTRGVLDALKIRIVERAQMERMQPAEVRFTQREARGWTGLSASSVKRHLRTLEAMELVHTVRGKKTWEYLLVEMEQAPAHWVSIGPEQTWPNVSESSSVVGAAGPCVSKRTDAARMSETLYAHGSSSQSLRIGAAEATGE